MTTDAGSLLLALARCAIEAELGLLVAMPPADADWLVEPGASFVTLTRNGRLRGCIGTLQAYRPLADDVRANARAAAFGDPRFPALTAAELRGLGVEVSVLSAPEPLTATSPQEALEQVRPGIDGLVLEHGRHRGTFLPQVWEQVPEPSAFLQQLQRKAGMPAGPWPRGTHLSRYTVTSWSEEPT